MVYFISSEIKKTSRDGVDRQVQKLLKALGQKKEMKHKLCTFPGRVPNNCVFLTWKNLSNECFKSPLETQLNISASQVILFYIFLVNILFCSHGFVK